MGNLLTRAKALAGVATVGGISAVLYGIGYIALNQRAYTLGIPDTTASGGSYLRTGYFFLIDSGSAFLTAGAQHAWWIGGAVVVAVASAWAAMRWRRRYAAARVAGALTALVIAGYVASTYAMTQAAWTIRRSFDARNLLMREDGTLAELSEPAQCVIKALADENAVILIRMYADVVGMITLGAAILGAAAFVTSRFKSAVPGLRHGAWIPAAGGASAVLLLPFFYGVCYLTVAPPCIGITATPQYQSELEKNNGDPRDASPVGRLASDVDPGGNAVQLLVVRQARARLFIVRQVNIQQILFLAATDCGSLLPGFAGRANCSYRGR